jgi:hypothetical protein
MVLSPSTVNVTTLGITVACQSLRRRRRRKRRRGHETLPIELTPRRSFDFHFQTSSQALDPSQSIPEPYSSSNDVDFTSRLGILWLSSKLSS